MFSYTTNLEYNILDIVKFQKSITQNNQRLSTIIEGCLFDNDIKKLTILSFENLNDIDIQNIHQVMDSYDNSLVLHKKTTNLGLQKTTIKNSVFTTFFILSHQPDILWSLDKLYLITNPILEQTDISFSIRLVDVNSNTIIGSDDFTISTYTTIAIDNITNITNNTILEIQCKITSDGGGEIDILSGTLEYSGYSV